MARSGLQSEVINLYRAFLRIAMQRKDEGAAAQVRDEFRKYQRNVHVRDIEQVEYLLRRAKNQLEVFRGTDVTRVSIWRPPIRAKDTA